MTPVQPLPPIQRLEIAHLHQTNGWLSPGYLEIDATGMISDVRGVRPPTWDGQPAERLDGFVVPGAINLHSHAHQRGLAGRAEGGSGATEAENFWRWRERMYAFVLSLDPDAFEAIAAQTYVEMLRAGFTTVGEFHYLHHDRDGSYYADPFEMSARVLAAADEAGVGLTVLPSLYRQGGIGRPPASEQRRFVHQSLDDFLALVTWLQGATRSMPLVRVGVAPHSVRAVSHAELSALLEAVLALDAAMPVHMHVAEQAREVEECLAALGVSPARWLLETLGVRAGWTFIHATHCTPAELDLIAARGVIVGLCPQTEANLGDGLFGLHRFHGAGGHWGIGSDSNLLIDPVQELRLLEYGQRLTTQRRSILVTSGDATLEQPGRRLYDLALIGGARSVAQPIGALEPGKRADLVVLEPDHPALVGQVAATVLDGWIMAGSREVVRAVMVGGRWVVRDGHHVREQEVVARYRRVMRERQIEPSADS